MFLPDRVVVLLALCAAFLISQAQGAEKPAGLSIVPDGWSIFVRQIVPGFNPRIPELKSVRELPLGTASFRMDPPHYADRLDIFPSSESRVLDISGSMPDLLGSFSKDGVVLYHENSATLVAIAPANDISKMEGLLGGEFGYVVALVRVTATLAEMTVPHRSKIEGVPYSRLRSIAGSSWKELEHFQISTKSAQRAVARSRQDSTAIDNPDSSNSTAPLLNDNENGAAMEIEPVITPDSQTVDLAFRWVRRANSPPRSLELMTSIAVADGATVVAGTWPLAAESIGNSQKGKPARALVLAFTVELITQDGSLFRDAFAQRLRQFRELRKDKPSKDKPAEVEHAPENE